MDFVNTHEWIKIEAPLPEEQKVTTIEARGKKICVGKLDGRYYGVSDMCPHAGISLGSGFCNAKGSVVCPMHQVAFDLKDGSNTTPEGYRPLTRYPIKLIGGIWHVGFSKRKWYQFWK